MAAGANDRLVQRPAMLLRLSIRLEDDGDAADDEAQSDAFPPKQVVEHLSRQLASLRKQQATAHAASDAAAQSKLRSQIRSTKAQIAASKSGQSAPTGAPDDLFTISSLVVVPIEASVELNGFRTADKLTASFPFSDLPLTSRIIRSALVEAWLGVVPATSFADPRAWKLPIDSVNPMFKGYVDEWKTEHKESESEVHIEARSMESILIDQKVNKLAPVFQVGRIQDADTNKTKILNSELITHYLNRFASALPNVNGALGGDSLRFKFDPRGREPSVSRKLFIRALQTARSQNQAAGGAPAPGAQAPAQPLPDVPPEPGTAEGTGTAKLQQPHAGCETSAWDIVTIACELVGCIPVYDPSVDPDNIIVRLPQTIYDDAAQQIEPEDGFSRYFAGPNSLARSPFRLMVWGRNVRDLSTSRKLGHVKSPRIECICQNNDADPASRVLVARFPPDHDIKASRIGAKGKNKSDEVITKVIHGARTQEQLMQIAASLYHQYGHHETSMHISTDSVSSYQDPSQPFDQDPDLLGLRPGSAVRVLVARYSQDPAGGLNLSPLSDVFGQDEGQIRSFLLEQFRREPDESGVIPYSDRAAQVADKIASIASQQKSRNLYYVRTASHKFDKEKGWSLEVEVATFARATTDPANMSAATKAINDRQKKPVQVQPVLTAQQRAALRAASVAGRSPL